MTTALRGGSVLRPVIAVVLFAKRRAIRTQFRAGLDEFAAQWNGVATESADVAAEPESVDDTGSEPPRTMTPRQWELLVPTIHRIAERGLEPWASWSHRLAAQEEAGVTPRTQFETFQRAFTHLRPLERGEAILAGMVESLTAATNRAGGTPRE